MTRPTSAGTITGPARVDGSPLALLRRLKPGDVAILDAPDLDGRTAQALASCRPAAVVNAGRSLSGRLPSPGPLTLLEAGIPVIDAAGDEVLGVREGATVRLEGAALSADGRTFDAGVLLERPAVEERMREAVDDLPVHIGSFTANALALLQHEPDLLLTGEGLPELRVPVRERAVVVVTPTFTGASTALRHFVRERRPVVIGVSSGADAARAPDCARASSWETSRRCARTRSRRPIRPSRTTPTATTPAAPGRRRWASCTTRPTRRWPARTSRCSRHGRTAPP